MYPNFQFHFCLYSEFIAVDSESFYSKSKAIVNTSLTILWVL